MVHVEYKFTCRFHFDVIFTCRLSSTCNLLHACVMCISHRYCFIVLLLYDTLCYLHLVCHIWHHTLRVIVTVQRTVIICIFRALYSVCSIFLNTYRAYYFLYPSYKFITMYTLPSSRMRLRTARIASGQMLSII